MATTKNITMKQFNGTDYDTLYPKTVAAQIDDVYSKDDCLTNSTKTAYGLGSSAVPNSIFATARTLIQNAQDTADSKCLVETGSYVGTGTYGSDNKNSLTFGGVPKMLVVSAGASRIYSSSRTNTLMIILYGMTGLVMTSMDSSGTNNMTLVNISQSGSNISWYGSDTAEGQLNKSGTTYYYVALL